MNDNLNYENGASRNYTTDGVTSTSRANINKQKILTTDELSSSLTRFDPTTLSPNSMILAVASRRSGKTTLVESMIHEYRKKNKVDLVLLYSKSNAGFPQIPQKYRFRTLNTLPQLVDTQLKIKKANTKRKNVFVKSNVIVIIDDFIDGSKTDVKSSDLLVKLSTMGRHLSHNDNSNMMVIMLSQIMTAIPPVVRRNMDYIITFKIASRIERKSITEEFLTLKSGRGGLSEAYNLFDVVNTDDFLALVINGTKSNKYRYSDYVFKYIANPKLPKEKWSGTNTDFETPLKIYF
tara:strand:+ start:7684 stop:8559 length:876 start_codon:yes stop_codon:yes gene_type:complete